MSQFGDCEVTLTASAAKGSAVLEKVFKVVVKAAEVPPVNPDMDDTGETEAGHLHQQHQIQTIRP